MSALQRQKRADIRKDEWQYRQFSRSPLHSAIWNTDEKKAVTKVCDIVVKMAGIWPTSVIQQVINSSACDHVTVSNHADPVRVRMSPIHLAAYRGHSRVLQLLCKVGADVNDATSERCDGQQRCRTTGLTALHWATSVGSFTCVRMLLYCGARVDVVTAGSFIDGVPQTVLPGKTQLHMAVESGFEVIARFLISCGATVDPDQSGQLGPLHAAALRCDPDIVKALVESGADLDRWFSVEQFGMRQVTALQLAASLGHVEICRLLCDAGASINLATAQIDIGDAADVNGGDMMTNLSALSLAAICGHVEVCRLLCRAGAAVDDSQGTIVIGHSTVDDSGLAALHWAAYLGRVKVIRALVLDYSADVTKKTTTRRLTPVACAVRRCQLAAARELMSCHQNESGHDQFQQPLPPLGAQRPSSCSKSPTDWPISSRTRIDPG